MDNIIFASGACGNEDAEDIYLLGRSIKDFGGDLSDKGLHVYIPEFYYPQWKDMKSIFEKINVSLCPYIVNRQDLTFEYSFKPFSAEAAENELQNGTIVWIDRNSLVLNNCEKLILTDSEDFAYRPVNIKNVGLSYDESISGIWEDIYRVAGVKEKNIFPMYSSVDQKKIRPYFFGSLFSFKAELKLMKKWKSLFTALIDMLELQALLKDEEMRAYLHQIALSAVILANIEQDKMRELPYDYGYPIHLHSYIPKHLQAADLEKTVTVFHCGELHDCMNAPNNIYISDRLRTWLSAYLNEIPKL